MKARHEIITKYPMFNHVTHMSDTVLFITTHSLAQIAAKWRHLISPHN